MKKPKLIHLMGAIIVLLAISEGFYYNLSDNPTKTTPDATSHGERYLAPNDNITSGTWSTVHAIGTPSVMGCGVSYIRNDTGVLYYIGGDLDFTGTTSARNESYNINTNTWTVNAPLPSTIELAGVASLKDSIYIVGGLEFSVFSTQSAIVYKYDIKANTWSQKAPLPVAVGGNKSVGYLDSLIYSVGGMTGGGSTATSAVYLYNCNTNTWRTATSLPAAECMGAFTVYGDSLFYIGGGATYAGPYTSTVYKGTFPNVMDKSLITWTTVAAYGGTSRWRFDACPWGVKGIIVAAGTGVEFGCSNECYILKANVWTAQPTMPIAVSNAGVGSVVYSNGTGKLVVASGTIYPGGPPYTTTTTQVFTDTVGAPPPSGYLCEGFISTTFPPTGWTNTNSTYIFRSAVSGYGLGTGSTYFDYWNAPVGSMGDLTTFTFYPIYQPGDSLQFDIAHCSFGANDSVTIYISTNGGTSWTYLFGMSSLYMQTVTSCTHPFTPTASQWGRRGFEVPLGTNKIRFHAYSGFGDGVFIDSVCCLNREGINNPANDIPKVYSLAQNYPNPFNPTTLINYSLPNAGNVELKVYDVLGREVAVLVNEFKHAGNYSVQFNANNFASGIYFYKLKAGDFESTKKMMLLK